MIEPLPYFAYGSNMWPEQMLQRCPGATPLGVSMLAKHSFLINERGVATVVPSETSVVEGVLWNVTAEHLEALDRFEGLTKGNYTRERRSLHRSGSVDAWIYVACHDTPSAPREGYLERVVAGAQHFGLRQQYVEEVRRWASPT